jgi:hypothetical protein
MELQGQVSLMVVSHTIAYKSILWISEENGIFLIKVQSKLMIIYCYLINSYFGDFYFENKIKYAIKSVQR